MKRASHDAASESHPAKRIKALDGAVINKIAAGEIIVAPVHALKELIENAVDARSTSLEISLKDGGMKMLQITDNGHGIHRDDLPILCERFTTSKLKQFEDLAAISTYGFRGEALASISHIAHLTITTRTADSSCAWRAKYEGGKLVPVKPGQNADPKPIAGREGTQITVEDLFYNMPQRRKAFKSPSEEYAKILDVVGRYAVHCEGVAFSCKKHSDPSMGIAVTRQNSVTDRVRQIYGSAVANDLMPFETSNEDLGFAVRGLMSNANHHAKKTTILLFINHRSVDSSSIRSAVQRTYVPWLAKGGHPFVYLALEIKPDRVDVNIHPTKREVNLLNEEAITEMICECLRDKLGKMDTSRTFLTQSLLPSTNTAPTSQEQLYESRGGALGSIRPAENNLVRTDPSVRKITSMFPTSAGETPASELRYNVMDRPHMQIRLTSIKELRSEVRDAMHGELSEVFSAHTFVGVVDTARRIVALQSGVRLYLVDYGLVCHEYFYQMGLTDFGNFGSLQFEEPLDVRKLLALAADSEQDAIINHVDLSNAPALVLQLLVKKREMLLEYFNLDITEDGQLRAIPLLARGYVPALSKLPKFLLRLGPCVDWHHEKDCFRMFLAELASLYVPERLGNWLDKASHESMQEQVQNAPPEESDLRARRRQICHSLEHMLFPAFKSRLIATRSLLRGVVEIANLKGLYRVFERC